MSTWTNMENPDYQLRFLLRELLAYAEQAPDKDAIVKHLEELLRDGEND